MEIGTSSESRFSRWFNNASPTKTAAKSTLPSGAGKAFDGAENFFSPISPASNRNSEPSYPNSFSQFLNSRGSDQAAPNPFLEFLQRGKFDKPGEQNAAAEHNNIPSVDELEARLRQTGQNVPHPGHGDASNAIPNIAIRPQQDMMAFKKLLEQISGDGSQQQACEGAPDMKPPVAYHPEAGLLHMLHKQHMAGHPGPPPGQHGEEAKKNVAFPQGLQPQQQQPQMQQRIVIHPPIDVIKKFVAAHTVPFHSPPVLSPQVRMDILKRPEAQALLKGTYSIFSHLFGALVHSPFRLHRAQVSTRAKSTKVISFSN